MSPLVRSRFLPEIENTGSAKRDFDVLLWLNSSNFNEWSLLDDLEILREYLSEFEPRVCSINLHVPQPHQITRRALETWDITFDSVAIGEVKKEIQSRFSADCPEELASATATASECDADLLVVSEHTWFPYLEDLMINFDFLLADVLKFQAEIFVRGFDIPWAFSYMAWHQPWTPFYPLTEEFTFKDGIDLFNLALKKCSQEAAETTRMLVLNRLIDLSFTRDRLLFYDIQQRAGDRAKWTRQRFRFETSYCLNFYYLLIFGGFDHVAMVINQTLKLGLPNKKVAAMSKHFLKALEQNAPEIHQLFIDVEFVSFMKRIAALRHLAAHRGSIVPSDVYVKPEIELTDQELDKKLSELGRDVFLKGIPAGPYRDKMQATLRQTLRLEIYEKVADGIVMIELNGKLGQIRPM